ncbi:MAG: MBL fold metallo-hydrolase [Clostridia bacterium]|nr:MBL fold metallo-hydrolase [Clostridia bacterium]
MAKGKGKLTKGAIAAIISIATTAVVISTLLIINLFFPLKYASAYFVTRSRSPSDGMYFHFLDVGHADCAIVEFPDGKVMLIDGGDGTYASTHKILKTLNGLDIDYIDYLVCTSVNEEHCGGLADIIEQKSVGTIYYPYSANVYITDEYYAFYNAAKECGAQMVVSEYGAGDESDGGEYFFVFLSPVNHGSALSEYTTMNTSPTAENMDNASAVMWIEYAGNGVFYASDVHTDILSSIVKDYNFYNNDGLGSYFTLGSHEVDFSNCVLYKTANHGSYDSICSELYNLLSPSYSVISVGEQNASDCPSVYVMADLYQYGDIFITMYTGDVAAKIDEGGAVIQ